MTSAPPPQTALHPRVGVSTILQNRHGQVLLGKRQGSHGAGTWQFPGGHLEYSEEIVSCAAREALEETGLVLRVSNDAAAATGADGAASIVAVTNDIFEQEHKHYITIFVRGMVEVADGEEAVAQVCPSQIMTNSDKMKGVLFFF